MLSGTSLQSATKTVLFFLMALQALAQSAEMRGDLPASKLTMSSVISVDLQRDIARVPLFRGTVNGSTVWYVIMDVSDERLARELGINFAPRLANADNGCPGCVQEVRSSNPVLGRANVEFRGTINFNPMRVYVPGPMGFPPLSAQPGAIGDRNYSDLLRIEGSSVVFNAPIVAVGNSPFDVVQHTNTGDRVMAIDIEKMTVDLLFIRAFSHGKDIFYFTFGGSAGLTAVLERGTFVPALGLLPFAGASEHPEGTRSAIFTFTNGQTGPTSPPAQGLRHVVVDGLLATEGNLQNTALLEALRRGGDNHAILDSFPTLRDPRLSRLYTPMWDTHLAVWSSEAVASGRNVAQTDANQIRQLAGQGLVSSPGMVTLSSANLVVNCPVLGFLNDPPTEPQAAKPPDPVLRAPSVLTGPIANAGPAMQQAVSRVYPLSAAESVAGEGGGPLMYQWRVIGKTAALSNANGLTAQAFLGEGFGDYVFELTVTDARGVSNSTRVRVSYSGR